MTSRWRWRLIPRVSIEAWTSLAVTSIFLSQIYWHLRRLEMNEIGNRKAVQLHYLYFSTLFILYYLIYYSLDRWEIDVWPWSALFQCLNSKWEKLVRNFFERDHFFTSKNVYVVEEAVSKYTNGKLRWPRD